MNSIYKTELDLGLLNRQNRLESARMPGFGHHADKFYRCEVIFGMPSADCAGTGICKIVVNRTNVQQEKKECKCTGAIFARSGETGEFSMLLFPELLCTRLYSRHLRQGILQLHEPCRLPVDMVTSLHLPFRLLQPGSYAVEVRHGYYQIKFNPLAGA
ncbi:MAG TPA: hypothetical protein PKL15_03620 [Saprospiraceae bacterium]|nr:hypothetical protein [Saprospiraceae bacterium]HNM24488.1 hypothetical protein [Saprospiraceae bacterium]